MADWSDQSAMSPSIPLNDADERMDDKIKVKAGDVAQQRQAMKKAGETPAMPAPAAAAPAEPRASKKGKGGRKPRQAATPQAVPGNTGPLEAARQVKELCDRYGAETVKGLADLFGR